MDLRRYRELPVVGEFLFAEPRGGRYAWAFFAVTVVYTVLVSVYRAPKVGLLAGGGLILLSIPHLLPADRYRTSVVLRIVGILYYVALWVVLLVVFPDAPTFFGGNW